MTILRSVGIYVLVGLTGGIFAYILFLVTELNPPVLVGVAVSVTITVTVLLHGGFLSIVKIKGLFNSVGR